MFLIRRHAGALEELRWRDTGLGIGNTDNGVGVTIEYPKPIINYFLNNLEKSHVYNLSAASFT